MVCRKSFGVSGQQIGQAITVDATGNVIVAGGFSGSANFGGSTLNSVSGNDIFLLALDSTGVYKWSKQFGSSTGGQQVRGIAADAAGDVFLIGSFAVTVDFGCGPLAGAGGTDVFLAKLDASGSCLWSKRFGDSANQVGVQVVPDGSGNIFISGGFAGSIDLGGGPVVNMGPLGIAAFYAKFDPSGNYLWSQVIQPQNGDGSSAEIAVDASGNLLAVGSFAGSIDLGGGPLVSAGGFDVYTAKFDPTGKHLWSRRFGDAEDQTAALVADSGMDQVVVTGSFEGLLDFGGASPLMSKAGPDIFLTQLQTP